MIKKVVCFIVVSVLIFIIVLSITNISPIVDAISNYPKDRIICYLLGALCMLLIQSITDRLLRRNNKSS